MFMNKICLAIPALTSGGAERVMANLANYFSKKDGIEVHLILFVKNEIFYELDPKVILHFPKFDYKVFPSARQTYEIFFFLRRTLKLIKPNHLLSFGGKYNSFVILSTLGLGIKSFVSDRSRPGIKYGFPQDKINKWIYRMTNGIVAQTTAAKDFLFMTTRHNNIKVIPNPVADILNLETPKENIILNVGRFIKSKQQEVLIDIFNKLNNKDWQLWFVGDGQYLDSCKKKVLELKLDHKIIFWGNQKDVYSFYQKSKIFAFTSISEGFPNSLAEAMSAGCACISFDCMAGPKDLIDNGISGLLIENNNIIEYIKGLKSLIDSDDLINGFSNKAIRMSQKLNVDKIADEYLEFIING